MFTILFIFQRRYLSILVLSSFFIFFVSGCSLAQKNREYHPLKQRELSELRKHNALYSTMEGIDAALYLNKADFARLVSGSVDAFRKNLSGLKSEVFSAVSLGDMAFHFSHQQLLSQVNFSFEVPELKMRIFGQLSAEHTLHAGMDAFVLKTNFNEVLLEGAEKRGERGSRDEEKSQITDALKKFIYILNSEITNTPLQIPVNMNIFSGLQAKDILTSADYAQHSAAPVKVQTKMQAYLPYIRPEGLIFLGSSQLKERTDETELRDDLPAMSAQFEAEIDKGLSETLGISLRMLLNHSSYYLSKSYLAAQMNLGLAETDIRFVKSSILKIKDKKQDFSKAIYFFEKERLPSCEGVRLDCAEQLLFCDRNCSEHYGVHKCESCEEIKNPFEKVRCMSRFEACKAQQELLLYECHKEENRCAAENDERQRRCELENLKRISVCEEKKEQLAFVNDEIMLARLLFSLKIDNSYAVQRIRQIRFDPELKRLESLRDIHISVSSRLKVELEKSAIADMECALGLKAPLLEHSQTDYTAQKRELPLLTQRGKKGELIIKAISKPDALSVHLKKKPFDKLLSAKEFVLRCEYQEMPMAAIPAKQLLYKRDIPYELNVILGEVELEFDEETFSFTLSPVKLGEDFLLYPTMEEKAVGFSSQGSFY